VDTLTIPTARLRTHCWVAGRPDGEPVQLVHGNLTTGRFWQALANELPDRFRLVAPDLPDFVRRLAAGDASAEEPASSPRV
jgi:pimeloyl-ACP methyl ester carboxylesterase